MHIKFDAGAFLRFSLPPLAMGVGAMLSGLFFLLIGAVPAFSEGIQIEGTDVFLSPDEFAELEDITGEPYLVLIDPQALDKPPEGKIYAVTGYEADVIEHKGMILLRDCWVNHELVARPEGVLLEPDESGHYPLLDLDGSTRYLDDISVDDETCQQLTTDYVNVTE